MTAPATNSPNARAPPMARSAITSAPGWPRRMRRATDTVNGAPTTMRAAAQMPLATPGYPASQATPPARRAHATPIGRTAVHAGVAFRVASSVGVLIVLHHCAPVLSAHRDSHGPIVEKERGLLVSGDSEPLAGAASVFREHPRSQRYSVVTRRMVARLQEPLTELVVRRRSRGIRGVELSQCDVQVHDSMAPSLPYHVPAERAESVDDVVELSLDRCLVAVEVGDTEAEPFESVADQVCDRHHADLRIGRERDGSEHARSLRRTGRCDIGDQPAPCCGFSAARAMSPTHEGFCPAMCVQTGR